ncbi:hypothetical protein D3C72_1999110 [compost metagenome]
MQQVWPETDGIAHLAEQFRRVVQIEGCVPRLFRREPLLRGFIVAGLLADAIHL